MPSTNPAARRAHGNSIFRKGSGTYRCIACGMVTRATGRGDNENAELCAPCYDEHEAMNADADEEEGPAVRYFQLVDVATGNGATVREARPMA